MCISNRVCVHARRWWRAFPDGQRDGGDETDSRGQRQTRNSSAAPKGHGKTHILSVSGIGLQDINLTALPFCLSVSCNQAYQDDDPRKYSVATVLVRVLAVNHFYPEFDMTEYRGFVTAGKTPASLVNTYGSKALMLHIQDQDFNHVRTPHTWHILPQHKHAQSSSVLDLYCYPWALFSPQIDRVSIPWSTSPSAPHQITQTSTKSHRRVFWSPRPINSNQSRNII